MSKSHIYPEEIRRFEREIIDFIVISGKDKRSSEIESHILAYFICHPSLTQKEIQEISAIFREKKISNGSIVNFLYKYEEYGDIRKSRSQDKRGTYIYTLTDRSIKALMAIGLETGLETMQKWIEYFEERVTALTEIKPELCQTEIHSVLLERLQEMRDFLIFHDNLMKNFLSGNFSIKDKPEIKISQDRVEKIKQKNILEIEKELIMLIQKNPLFMIDKEKYLPIYSYLLIRRRLIQLQLKELTGLSSGIISEGLNYLIQKNLIELDKQEGIRKRFYVIPSIGYSNYQKQYQRFQRINELKSKIERIYQEMTNRESELKALNGFQIIWKWVKEALHLFSVVEAGIKIFEKALDHFNLTSV